MLRSSVPLAAYTLVTKLLPNEPRVGASLSSTYLQTNFEFALLYSFRIISNYLNKKSKVLLSSLICFLIDETAHKYGVKCLLDADMESNFLSCHFIELLGIKNKHFGIRNK